MSNKRIVKNTFYLYIRMAIVLAVSLYSTRRVLSVLGAVDFGIYNIVCGFVFMFAFFNSSLSACIQRYYNHEFALSGDAGVQKVYISGCIIQTAFTILICLITEIFGYWYITNYLVLPVERLQIATYVFHFSVVSMGLNILQVPFFALIISKEKMDYFALIGIIDVFLKLAAVIVLPYLSYDKLAAYAFSWMLISIANFLFYYVYVKIKFSNIRFKFHIYSGLLKSMSKFTLWNTFGAFSIMLKNQGLNILLNSFFGPIVNAARGVAFQIQSALMGFVSNLSTAARPQIVEKYSAGERSEAYRLFYAISKISFVLLYMMVLPIAVELNYILNIWLDKVPDYTHQFTIIILVTALVDVLNTPLTTITNASGRVKTYNIITSIIGIAVLPMSFIALKLGASPEWVFICSLFTSVIVQYFGLRNLSKISDFTIKEYWIAVLRPILILIIITVPFPMLAKQIPTSGIISFLITLMTTTLTIALVSYFIALTHNEKEIVKSYIKKIIK